jgi:hypothetical protein
VAQVPALRYTRKYTRKYTEDAGDSLQKMITICGVIPE